MFKLGCCLVDWFILAFVWVCLVLFLTQWTLLCVCAEDTVCQLIQKWPRVFQWLNSLSLFKKKKKKGHWYLLVLRGKRLNQCGNRIWVSETRWHCAGHCGPSELPHTKLADLWCKEGKRDHGFQGHIWCRKINFYNCNRDLHVSLLQLPLRPRPEDWR